jgi:hypothetical protein
MFRKVFSAKGQPQWRRKEIMVGLPSCAGIKRFSLGVEGAGWLMVGGSAVWSRDGVIQDQNSVWKVMVDWEGEDVDV